MRGLIYQQFGQPLQVKQVPDPQPGAHDVVVQVKATGICRSDWHGWMGYDPDITLPHIPGHELAGEVVALGAQVRKFKRGDRLTIPFVAGCGNCVYCMQGDPQVCNHQFQPGFSAWGSFAEFVRLQYIDYNGVHLPETLSYETAAALGCRFSTSFRAVVHQGQIKPEEYLVVFGCGGVGLSAIMIAKAYGATVIAIDRKESALALAKQMGADHCILASDNFDPAEVLDLTQEGAHLTIDALGHHQIIASCFSVLRKRGRHIQIGLMEPHHRQVAVPMDQIIANELQIMGSHGIQASFYPQMFDLIESGSINPQLLIQKKLKLSEAGQALSKMDQHTEPGIQMITQLEQ